MEAIGMLLQRCTTRESMATLVVNLMKRPDDSFSTYISSLLKEENMDLYLKVLWCAKEYFSDEIQHIIRSADSSSVKQFLKFLDSPDEIGKFLVFVRETENVSLLVRILADCSMEQNAKELENIFKNSTNLEIREEAIHALMMSESPAYMFKFTELIAGLEESYFSFRRSLDVSNANIENIVLYLLERQYTPASNFSKETSETLKELLKSWKSLTLENKASLLFFWKLSVKDFHYNEFLRFLNRLWDSRERLKARILADRILLQQKIHLGIFDFQDFQNLLTLVSRAETKKLLLSNILLKNPNAYEFIEKIRLLELEDYDDSVSKLHRFLAMLSFHTVEVALPSPRAYNFLCEFKALIYPFELHAQMVRLEELFNMIYANISRPSEMTANMSASGRQVWHQVRANEVAALKTVIWGMLSSLNALREQAISEE